MLVLSQNTNMTRFVCALILLVPHLLLSGQAMAFYGGSLPRTIKAAGGTIWSPYFDDVTAALVAEAHELKLSVVAWTVNKPEDMARLINIGVDGIISDRPDLLRKVAADKGIALPAVFPVTP